MAASLSQGRSEEKLTDAEIATLAGVVSMDAAESMAQRYLGVNVVAVENLKLKHRGQYEAFNRDIFKIFVRKNPGSNQQKVGD